MVASTETATTTTATATATSTAAEQQRRTYCSSKREAALKIMYPLAFPALSASSDEWKHLAQIKAPLFSLFQSCFGRRRAT